jgi:hypothetical protein
VNPQDLARAHENTLRKYCCKKCGGRLVQVYDQASDKYIVACGPNRCYPLKIRSTVGRAIQRLQEELDAREVEHNYPDLAPKRTANPSHLFQE